MGLNLLKIGNFYYKFNTEPCKISELRYGNVGINIYRHSSFVGPLVGVLAVNVKLLQSVSSN